MEAVNEIELGFIFARGECETMAFTTL
jgi:hypothetical protein